MQMPSKTSPCGKRKRPLQEGEGRGACGEHGRLGLLTDHPLPHRRPPRRLAPPAGGQAAGLGGDRSERRHPGRRWTKSGPDRRKLIGPKAETSSVPEHCSAGVRYTRSSNPEARLRPPRGRPEDHRKPVPRRHRFCLPRFLGPGHGPSPVKYDWPSHGAICPEARDLLGPPRPPTRRATPRRRDAGSVQWSGCDFGLPRARREEPGRHSAR